MSLIACKNSRKTRWANINKILVALDVSVQTVDYDQIEENLAILDVKESALKTTCEELISLTADDDLETEITKNDEFVDFIVRARIRANRCLRSRSQNTTPLSSPGSPSPAKSRACVKLPKLEIRAFSGNIIDWERFWDQFCAGIHTNTSLTEVDKFNYLKGLLTEQAAITIQGLKLTEVNYVVAVELLKKKYGKTDVLVNEHISRLVKLKRVQHTNSGEDLRRFLEDFLLHMRALEALGTQVISMGAVLCPLIREAIPTSLLLEWNRQTHGLHDSDLIKILGFIETELEGIELAWRAQRDFSDTGNNSTTEKQVSAVNSERKSNAESKKDNNVGYRKTSAATLLTVGEADSLTKSKNKGKTTRFTRRQPFCSFCDGDHFPTYCKIKNTNAERLTALKERKRCFLCFRKEHVAKDCTAAIRCRRCKASHHTLLCPARDQPSEEDPTEPNTTTVASVLRSGVSKKQKFATVLQVLRLWIHSGENNKQVVALLDGGSERSFVCTHIVQEMGLTAIAREELDVQTFGSKQIKQDANLIPLQLSGMQGQKLDMEAYEVADICSGISLWETSQITTYLRHPDNRTWEHTMGPGKRVKVDILIGADWYWQVITGQVQRITPFLVATESIFGWVLQGRGGTGCHNPPIVTMLVAGQTQSQSQSCAKGVLAQEESSLDNMLQRFWRMDQSGILEMEDQVEQTLQETMIVESFNKTTTFDGIRYEVRIPWNEKKDELGENRRSASIRLKKLLQQLQKQPEIFSRYCAGIQEHLTNGHAEYVLESTPPRGPTYYMPHRPVIDEERLTTKMRIVFDASAKEKGHLSLNECQHTGPDLNPALIEVLLRFRRNKIAMIADISKAYLQIQLHPDDRDVLRFLWVDDEWQEHEQPCIRTLRMLRVPFGMRASAFLLAATIRLHLDKNGSENTDVKSTISEDMYVDDLVSGKESTREAYQAYRGIQDTLAKGGFPMSKWVSNDPSLNDTWHKEGAQHSGQSQDPRKVLGMVWTMAEDTFSFRTSKLYEALPTSPNTKRGVLEVVARVYDPLGLICPKMVEAKTLLQHLWKANIAWDEDLPEDLQEAWTRWKQDLTSLHTITIPRWCGMLKLQAVSCQIHAFCDASPLAYGVVVYLKLDTSQSKSELIQFIGARSKIAPIKAISIPRLELLSCVVGARFVATIRRAWQTESIKVCCWSDSTVALHWIKEDPGSWKLFVGRRVQEIQGFQFEWKYCPGKDNPADMLTRGESLEQLANKTKWWKGPDWLSRGTEDWPPQPVSLGTENEELVTQEASQTDIIVAAIFTTKPKQLFDYKRHDRWTTIIRITAWIIRFTSNCRRRNDDRQRQSLTSTELQQAEHVWFRFAQVESFSKERRALRVHGKVDPSSRISHFRPFLDENGLIRIGGRLKFSPMEDFLKHPIILQGSGVVEKFIMDQHVRSLHGGIQITLIKARAKVWILKGRQTIRKVIKSCLPCRRWTAAPATTVEGPLPKERIEETLPFQTVGVDFAGPIWMKNGRRREKGYICLFTCAVTRAVHLELTTALGTKPFLLALRRFVARRGCCKLIYSDNAQAFKQSDRLLKASWQVVQSHLVQDFVSGAGIKWNFIPPRAAWWGGFYERLVGSVKRHLRRVLGNALLDADELHTILVEIEAIVNSRPLSSLSEDAEDEEHLTPFHFLLGHPSQSLPDMIPGITVIPAKETLIRRWRYRKRLMDGFWKKWKEEYLLQLSTAHQVKNPDKTLKIRVGDVVILQQDLTPRGQWKLARVTEVHIGRDQQIRSVTVKTGKGKLLRRGLRHVCPLEVSE